MTLKGIEPEITALVAGIKAADPERLFTAQPAPEERTLDWYGGTAQAGWLDINTTYSYQMVHQRVLDEYNRKPVMPLVMIESSYEGEHNASPAQVRRQAYWAILSGACGQFFGNNPIWLFNPGWQAALGLEGSRSMQHLHNLFASRPWQQLIPDQKHTGVVAGLGDLRGLDTLTAACTADHATLIAYIPTPRTVTVDLSKISGSQACAWWYDPRSGAAQAAGLFPTGEPLTLATPAGGDWVLVVDDAARAYPAPGTKQS